MVIYPWNFTHVKRQPCKKIFFIRILNFFQGVKFILDVLKTFVSTLCDNDNENCDFLML